LPTNSSRGFSECRRSEFPTESAHGDRAVAELVGVRLDAHFEAELLQTLDHHLRIFAPKRAFERHFASASAARMSARFVMLFEPGTVISA
jgi:hypothetical protein